MAAESAHELNTILGLVSGDAELLSRNFADGSIERRNAQQIVSASFRARDLFSRMLALWQQNPTRLAELDVLALIKDVLKTVRATVPIGVRMTFKSDLHAARVLADPSQIDRIVTILCETALDAMNGKGNLDIAMEMTRPMAANGRPASARLCLVVAHDGLGMTPQAQSRAFDPFRAAKAPGKRSGPGLSVAYAIVPGSGAKSKSRARAAPALASRCGCRSPIKNVALS